jgi:hypothetical protein
VGDYSNYSTPPMHSYVLFARSGERLQDEVLMGAIDTLVPPLFDEPDMAALRKELDPRSKPKRGRPSLVGPNRLTLAAKLKHSGRLDLPGEIRTALLQRLETGERFNQLTGAHSQWRDRKRSDRIKLMEFFYREIYAALGGHEPVELPSIGFVPLPQNASSVSRSERALLMTRTILREHFRIAVPSLDRMRNALSENSRKKREKIRAFNALVTSLPSQGATSGKLRLQQSPADHGAVGIPQAQPD